MKAKVKGLLQKINFIETDMDLQRQILVSIPSDQADQMEAVVQKIAAYKEQIQDLRAQIQSIDPEEYDRIIAIEEGTWKFQQLAADKKFVEVNTLNDTGECFIQLNDNTRIDCLVAAKDEQGNWTVLTLDGETRTYPAGIIK